MPATRFSGVTFRRSNGVGYVSERVISKKDWSESLILNNSGYERIKFLLILKFLIIGTTLKGVLKFSTIQDMRESNFVTIQRLVYSAHK